MRLCIFIFFISSIFLLSSFEKKSYISSSFLDTLKKDTLNIDTVGVSKALSAEQRYEARKKQYRTIYKSERKPHRSLACGM